MGTTVYYLGNIINHKLSGVCISITKQPKDVELIFTRQNATDFPTDEEGEFIIQRIKEVSLEILEAVNLINMLEKEGYILLLQATSNIPNTFKFGGCVSYLPSIPYTFSDEKISDLLLEFVNKEILCH